MHIVAFQKIADTVNTKGLVYPHGKNHGLFLYDSLVWIDFVVISQKEKRWLYVISFFFVEVVGCAKLWRGEAELRRRLRAQRANSR